MLASGSNVNCANIIDIPAPSHSLLMDSVSDFHYFQECHYYPCPRGQRVQYLVCLFVCWQRFCCLN